MIDVCLVVVVVVVVALSPQSHAIRIGLFGRYGACCSDSVPHPCAYATLTTLTLPPLVPRRSLIGSGGDPLERGARARATNEQHRHVPRGEERRFRKNAVK